MAAVAPVRTAMVAMAAAMAAVAPAPPAAGTERKRVAAWFIVLSPMPRHGCRAREEQGSRRERHLPACVRHSLRPVCHAGDRRCASPLNVDRWRDRLSRAPDQMMASFGKDTNFPLLDSALAALRAAAPEADFTIFTGDLLAHEFEAKAAKAFGVDERSTLVQAFAVATTNFVARMLGRAIPSRPVIIALGNDDAACGDYRIDPGGPYLAATRGTVREFWAISRSTPTSIAPGWPAAITGCAIPPVPTSPSSSSMTFYGRGISRCLRRRWARRRQGHAGMAAHAPRASPEDRRQGLARPSHPDRL